MLLRPPLASHEKLSARQGPLRGHKPQEKLQVEAAS